MITFITVPPRERAALIVDGRFTELVRPGTHGRFTGLAPVEVVRLPVNGVPQPVPIGDPIPPDTPGLTEFTVGAAERVAAFVGDTFAGVFGPGRFRLVTTPEPLRLVRFDLLAEPGPLAEDDTVPVLVGIPVFTANAAQALVLHRDGVPERTLERGRFRVVPGGRFSVTVVPLQVQTLELAVQELLTRDQVPVRVKPAVSWRVVDALERLRQPDFAAQLHAAVHAALREVVTRHDLEALLAAREPLDVELGERARAGLAAVGVAIERVVIRDVTLTGEVKELFNKVTLAKKEAEALAIKRREETAATRQLANTAKLLADNPVLLRLRELEALTELAGKVGNLTVVGGRELLEGVTLADRGRG